MTANTETASIGTKLIGPIFYWLVALSGAFLIYKYSWSLGTTWLLAAALLHILFMGDRDKRVRDLWIWFSLVILIVVSATVQGQLTRNGQIVEAIRNSTFLTFLAGSFAETVFWSIVIGLIITALLIGFIILPLSYIAAVYVLALPEFEGVSGWDAMKYVITLLFGMNLPVIVIQNGEARIAKKLGKIEEIFGPGQLIIKEGHVVVLEKGGKISRIVNAGMVKLQKHETIRNILLLTPQSNSAEIEHVLTKDRIPLTITMSIKIQLEPAAEADKRPESHIVPDGEALTRKLDDGLYQVYEGTIRKAALILQLTAEKWKNAAGSVPVAELRDHILSHSFDELFEVVSHADGKPEVRVDKRKIYEIEQAILNGIKPGKLKGLGVVVRGVDIGKVEFPEGAENLLLDRWKTPWQQEIMNLGAEGRVTRADFGAKAIVIRARARAQLKILQGQGEGEARAAFFREVLREMRREGVDLEDNEILNAILSQMISTLVSVEDLRAFVKLAGIFDPISRRQIGTGSDFNRSKTEGS